MPPVRNKAQAAQEVLDILHEISILLNTGLDRATLCICVSLIENGVNPDALAVGVSNRVAVWIVAKASIEQTVVRELRKRGPQSPQLESGSE